MLVITTNEFQSTSGGSALLRSLFNNFDRKNLFVIHKDHVKKKYGPQFYLSFRFLRPRIKLIKLFLLAFIEIFRTFTLPSRQDLINLILQGSKYSIPFHVQQKILKFSPDVIYGWAGDSLWANLVFNSASKLKLPFVIHFMDNHFELSGKTVIEKILNDEYRQNISKGLLKSEKIFTISSAMGKAYKKIFSKKYEVFHALFDASSWPKPEFNQSKKVFNITFAGSLENGQTEAIKDIAKAIDKLSLEGFKIDLTFCTTKYYEKRIHKIFGGYAYIKYIKHPDIKELPKVFKNANVLLLAYGFDKETIEYYRYSFATKIVPYTFSARCIFGYGPKSIEPINNLIRGGYSYVVTESSVDKLAKTIKFLINNPEECNKFAKLAYKTGLIEYDMHKQSKKFELALQKVANIKT